MSRKTEVSDIKRKKRVRKAGTFFELGCWVRADGVYKWIRLGREGDPGIDLAYKKVKAEFYAKEVSVADLKREGAGTMATLFFAYIQKRLPRLAQADRVHVKKILAIVGEKYADTPAEAFDSLAFRDVQDMVAKEGMNSGKEGRKKVWSYAYCNKLTGYLRQVLKWGVGRKLFPAACLLEIQQVEAIGKGDEVYDLDDTEPVKAVDDETVKKSLPYLNAVVADMVRIQRAACMRPSEVCSLRVLDVLTARRGVVTIGKHKTMRFHVKRYAAFSPAEMEILRKHCRGKGGDEYVFSPRDAIRPTWESYGWSEEKIAEKSLFYADHYTTETYYHAIQYRLKKAREAGVAIPRWFPYQLRHAAVTANSLRYGVETAAYIAGHKSLKTTEIYDHKGEALARLAAEERGDVPSWWED